MEEIRLLREYLDVHPDTELRKSLEARIADLEAKLGNNEAKYVKTITAKDPDSEEYVEMEVFKHECGGMFAIDSSYLEQVFDDDTDPVIPDPFSLNLEGATSYNVTLLNL